MSSLTFTLTARELPDKKGWELLAPTVGFFSQTPDVNQAMTPGMTTGTLTILGRTHTLLLPKDIGGILITPRTGKTQRPVEYGEVLFCIQTHDGALAFQKEKETDSAEGEAVIRAPQAGRFYHRPTPEEALFVQEGDTIQVGKTTGLLEVMKTFNPVKMPAEDHLPSPATVVRLLVADGADVEEGQALVELA